MSRLFISHSSHDNRQAVAISQWLTQRGWSDFFLDLDPERGIVAGERWLQAFLGAVTRCEAVLFLLSESWCRSRYCLHEVTQAKAQGKRLFGVVVAKVAMTLLPLEIGEWQICDLTQSGEAECFDVEGAADPVCFNRQGLDRLARGLRRAGLDPRTFPWPPLLEPTREPYRGLDPLDEADAGIFFGRDATLVRAIDQLRQARERGTERMFVLLGASGAGKSSFLRAGLLPRLRNDVEHFAVLPPVRPSDAVISGPDGLLESLYRGTVARGASTTRNLIRDALESRNLAQVLEGWRLAHPVELVRPPTVVLPLDQAEELLHPDGRTEAETFVRLMNEVGSTPNQMPMLVVCTVRSDVWPALQGDGLLRSLSSVLFDLPAMPPSNYHDVIKGPAQRHSEAVKAVLIDPRLAEQLVEDSAGTDALPLLALSLQLLYRQFDRPERTSLRLEDYKVKDGVRGVIEEAIKRAFASPDATPVIPRNDQQRRDCLRRVFPLLATVDPDSGEPRRLQAKEADLVALGTQTHALVNRLVEFRLLRRERRSEGAGDSNVIEVAHEAVLRQWRLLTEWTSDHAEGLRAVELVRRAAVDWARELGEKNAALAHRGERLDKAESLCRDEAFGDRFDQTMRDYLVACRESTDREQRQREADQAARELAQAEREQAQAARALAQEQTMRAQRRFATVLGVGLLAGLMLGCWILVQTVQVQRQTARVLAEAAERALEAGQNERALRFALLAVHEPWLSEQHPVAASVLARAADRSRFRFGFSHGGRITAIAFSPDGARVLTGSEDKTARLWDAHTGKALGEVMRHEDALRSVAFSPDGALVLTGSKDNTARLWDSRLGNALALVMRHQGGVNSAVFSPRGDRILTGSDDKTARIWDVHSGAALMEPMGHADAVKLAIFSPDGSRLLTAANLTAQLWDAESGSAVGLAMSDGSNREITSAVFSPDGAQVLTTTSYGTAQLWDARSGKAEKLVKQSGVDLIRGGGFSPDSNQALIILSNYVHSFSTRGDAPSSPVRSLLHDTNYVYSAMFSPNGELILTASGNKIAQLWDASTGHAIDYAMNHDDPVVRAIFSPEGDQVLTQSGNNAWLWHVGSGKLLYHVTTGNSRTLLSRDGTRVLTSSEYDDVARLYDARTGKALSVLKGNAGWATDISPDGRRVLTIADNSVFLWDVNRAKVLGEAMRHAGRVTSAVFSSDGERVLTEFKDSRTKHTAARLWDAHDGSPLAEVMRHDDPIKHASFCHDGEWVLTQTITSAVRMWSALNGRALGQEMPRVVARTSNCERVLATSEDGTARIRNARDGKEVGELMRYDSPIVHADFSPDGERLLTLASDGTARLWNGRTGESLGKVSHHDSTILQAEFSPDGERLLTLASDGSARLWSGRGGESLGELMWHKSPGTPIFSPDSKTVLTISDTTARLWNTRSGKALGELMRHDSDVNFAMFSADGRRVLTTDVENSARVWDAGGARGLGEVMRHAGPIDFAGFSKDGNLVVTSSVDKTDAFAIVQVWSAYSGKALGNGMRHPERVRRAVFGPNGGQILTFAESGVRLWDTQWEALANSPERLVEHVCRERASAPISHIRLGDLAASVLLDMSRVDEDTCRRWFSVSFENLPTDLPHLPYQ